MDAIAGETTLALVVLGTSLDHADRRVGLMNLVKRFVSDESGSTAVEYALIAAGIVLAGYTSLKAVGAVASGLFSTAVVNLSATGP